MNPQTENAPSSTWSALVPPELNDVLREQAPGARNRNFRLECRKAWVESIKGSQTVAVSCQNVGQERVLALVNELLARARA